MRKHLLYILCGMLLLTGCDYLNRVPEKDIETVESLFEQRTKAESWWKGLYGEINTVLTSLTNNTSFLGADEFVTCQALYNSTTFRLDGLKVADGLQMSQSPYGSLWYKMYTVIRNANTFLENIWLKMEGITQAECDIYEKVKEAFSGEADGLEKQTETVSQTLQNVFDFMEAARKW